VVDLNIAKVRIEALWRRVGTIRGRNRHRGPAKQKWSAAEARCAGQIGTLVELLQALSKA